MRTSAPTKKKKREYKEKQSWYALKYDVSLGTIKRWEKLGRPLDDPDAMGEYLSNRGRPKDEDDFEEDPPPRDPDDIAADRLKRFGDAFLSGDGLGGAIKRYRVLEIEAADRLAEAMMGPNPKERMNRLNEYNSIVEHLRKIEKDNPDIESANSKSISISEVEDGVTKLLFDLSTRLDTLPVRGMKTLVGLNAQEIRDELEAEIEKVKIPIRACLWIPEAERAKLPRFEPPPAVPESGTHDARVHDKKLQVPRRKVSGQKTSRKKTSTKATTPRKKK